MNLRDSLLSDMKGALKAKDSIRLNTIRGLISEIKNREIGLRRELGDDEIISIITTQIKKRKEAAALFEKGGRGDLCEKENQDQRKEISYFPVTRKCKEIHQRSRSLRLKSLSRFND